MPKPNRKRQRRDLKPAAALAVTALVHPQPGISNARFTELLLKSWWAMTCAAYPHPQHRAQWARTVCLLASLETITLGAIRMQHLLAGAWDGLRHTPGQVFALDNATVMLPPTAAGPLDFAVKGAISGGTLQWRYPKLETLCAGAQCSMARRNPQWPREILNSIEGSSIA